MEMAQVNIQEYIPTIRKILLESDLKAISAKDVRKKLEELYKVDLTLRKPEVQELIEQCFDELDVDEEIVPKYEPKPDIKSVKSKTKPKSKPAHTNESDFSSLEDDHPPPVKKKHKKKPKTSSKEVDALDATSEDINSKRSKAKNGDKKKKSHKRKKTEEVDDDEAPKKKKGNTGIHRPLLLSPVLSEFLGEEELSRLEVVKRLWTYIKDNNLQDPADKRFIICDERLTQIFGKDRMHSFTMNKYLTDHLKKKEDVVGGDTIRNRIDTGQGHSGGLGDEEESGDQGEGSIKMEDLFGNDSPITQNDDETSTKNESPE